MKQKQWKTLNCKCSMSEIVLKTFQIKAPAYQILWAMQGWEVDWHDGHVNLPSVCQICENTSVSPRWQAGSVPPGAFWCPPWGRVPGQAEAAWSGERGLTQSSAWGACTAPRGGSCSPVQADVHGMIHETVITHNKCKCLINQVSCPCYPLAGFH